MSMWVVSVPASQSWSPGACAPQGRWHPGGRSHRRRAGCHPATLTRGLAAPARHCRGQDLGLGRRPVRTGGRVEWGLSEEQWAGGGVRPPAHCLGAPGDTGGAGLDSEPLTPA